MLVPPGASVLTNYELLVWYADRPVIWLPSHPVELDLLRRWTGPSHVLWQEGPGSHGTAETWRRHFEHEVATGAMRRVGELRLTSGIYILGEWGEAPSPGPH